jgi:hypothetical protein
VAHCSGITFSTARLGEHDADPALERGHVKHGEGAKALGDVRPLTGQQAREQE